MKKRPVCKICGSYWHYQSFCSRKPQTQINRNKLGKIRPRNKTVQREREFKNQYLQDNPPDQWGYYLCYLQIHPLCPKRLTVEQMTLEHIIPAGRGEKYKYDPKNIKPACAFCNGLKGSRTLEALAKDYPHLKVYLA